MIHVPELTLFGAPYTPLEIYNSTIHNLNPDNPDDMLQLLAPAAESPEVQDSTAVEEIVTTPLPAYYFRPAVFSSFQFLDTMRVSKSAPLADSPLDPQYLRMARHRPLPQRSDTPCPSGSGGAHSVSCAI